MADKVWVLAEQWRGGISEVTGEVMALGREVASGMGATLEAVLLGHGMRPLADSIPEADSVLYVDHAALAEPVPESHAAVLAGLVQERRPRCLLVPLTNLSMDVATLVAAQLDAPLVNLCKDVRVVEGRLEAKALLYGGKLEATVVPCGEPAILAIIPGSRSAAKGARKPAVEEIAAALPQEPAIRFERYIEPEAGDVDITRQDVLVAIGRGIQNKENVGMAEELAQALGGALCGSRPVIDQGFLGLSRQVGKSGMTVKPKLYLALGISGAPEHVEGMKGSGLIIAVNTDPNAPIFEVAHYGIVGDALELAPELTSALRARKG